MIGLLTAAMAIAPASAAGSTFVICAPGFPATTQQAQETMDVFAEAVASAAGWSGSDLAAVFLATEKAGLDRIAEGDAPVVMVPLEFFLAHEEDLALHPIAQAVQDYGAEELWSLVAKKGAIAGPASLAGWQVTGRPGYVPAFVRGPVLGTWGSLPEDTVITPTERPLSALRKAAAGEKVAVLLDREQAGSLASLPFAGELEVVARSEPLPGIIVAMVGDRLTPDRAAQIRKGLLSLKQSEGELLRTMRLAGFQEIDGSALDAARGAFGRR
jgi:hypothetical protein